jgi:hypothetical protein
MKKIVEVVEMNTANRLKILFTSSNERDKDKRARDKKYN